MAANNKKLKILQINDVDDIHHLNTKKIERFFLIPSLVNNNKMYHAMEIIQICKNRNSQQGKQFITGLARSVLGVYSLNTEYIVLFVKEELEQTTSPHIIYIIC